jgi:hypothetical protein
MAFPKDVNTDFYIDPNLEIFTKESKHSIHAVGPWHMNICKNRPLAESFVELEDTWSSKNTIHIVMYGFMIEHSMRWRYIDRWPTVKWGSVDLVCPHCGSNARLRRHIWVKHMWNVICGCGATGPQRIYPDLAVEQYANHMRMEFTKIQDKA